ncbi:hypothetical protein L1987_61970 [Smallanthus sonchifolius]|uniref:Uncharacterized protein n=1 Tax=Smallanthus sonchifolius TaxID=185202 RepID=A0ACB9C937_9ASTR|nr:hypothetical protein L1987_61970 [Smallanthus sonchifolius]
MSIPLHPNIGSQNGFVSLNSLKGDWTSAMNLTTTLIALQALLSAPEISDPQDDVVALQYLNDHPKFIQKAKRWTLIHANIQDDNPATPPQHNVQDGNAAAPPQQNIQDANAAAPPQQNVQDGTAAAPPQQNVQDGNAAAPPPQQNIQDGNAAAPPQHRRRIAKIPTRLKDYISQLTVLVALQALVSAPEPMQPLKEMAVSQIPIPLNLL